MRIGIFGSNRQAGKQESIKTLFDTIRRLGGKVWVEAGFYRYLSEQFAYAPEIESLIESDVFPLDMVISLGGDGTFLRTAAWVGRREIPVLGINTGRLGFLADIGENEIVETLEEVLRGDYLTEERSLLELQTPLPQDGDNNFALNEIAVLKRDTASMIAVHTSLNEEFLTSYLADGLLIATATGSTAYSMSVNGPIIIPQSKNIVLSPVAPHSLNVRPLVIPEDYRIRLKVETRNGNFLISLDGRSAVYPSESEFLISKANFCLKIVKRTGQSFYDTLRKKLLWGTDVREVASGRNNGMTGFLPATSLRTAKR
ncbi:MAG: NAD kinase [Dysgonamonadaceae bacterium]|jgi:NAD+ kinase|nr:NAD kinase [Dysgonamonadaceae bacterium]